MSGNTAIQWTDKTWNPVVGCTKVAPECKFCYAKTVHDKRHKAILEGKPQAPQYREEFEVVQLKPDRLRWPVSLQKPSRIFVNSVSDLFHEDVPMDFIAQVFAVMALADRHTFQVLTKRASRQKQILRDPAFREMVDTFVTHFAVEWTNPHIRRKDDLRATAPDVMDDGYWPLPNVEIGVSAGTQKAWDANVPELLDTPAAIRFVSMEPLLEEVDILWPKTVWPDGPQMCCSGMEGGVPSCGCHGLPIDPPTIMNEDMSGVRIDWIIVGGESGTRKQKVRPMHAAWVRKIRDACQSWGVAFFFKQWGEYLTFSNGSRCLRYDDERQEFRAHVDGKVYGRDALHFWTSDGGYDPLADWSVRVGTKKAGRQIDGVEHNTFARTPARTATTGKVIDLMEALKESLRK